MATSPADRAGFTFARAGRLLLPVLVALLVAVVFAAFWWLDRQYARDRLRDETRVAAEQIAAGLEGSVREHLQLLHSVHVLVRAGAIDSEGEFRRIAEAAQHDLPGLVAMRRVTVEGDALWRASRSPRVPAADTAAARSQRRAALEAGAIRLTPLLELGGRSRLVAAYLPLPADEGPGGLIEVVYDSASLVRPLLDDAVSRRYRVRVAFDDSTIHLVDDGVEAAGEPLVIRRSFDHLGGTWDVELAPRFAAPRAQVRAVVLVIGALVTLLALGLSRRLSASKQRLRASEARFRDFADIAADWFWEVDADLRYTYLSERYEEITGIPRHRVLGRQRRYVLGEAGVEDEELRRQYALIEARKPFRVERCMTDAEGRERIYQSQGRPFYDERGRFGGYRGIGRDVTPQRENEQRLRQAAAVFDGSTEAVIVADPEERIVRVNRAFTEMTGYAEHEVLGSSVGVLRSETDHVVSNDTIGAALEDSGEWRGETRVRGRDGGVHPVWECISEVRDEQRRLVNYVYVMLDISELKEYQAHMERLAHHDGLTGLPNRVLFETRLDQALERAGRQDLQVAVLFLDVDGFKKINDARGHAAGDDVLRTIAERLTQRLRGSDTIARIAGDEFLVVLDDIKGERAAARVAAELADLIGEPFQVEGEEVMVTASIGVALYPRDGRDVESLVGNADAAMYRAKEEGRNRYCLYTEEITISLQRRLQVERRLRRALEQRELALHYQPQFAVAGGELVGAEALVRWEDAELGRVGPDEFIAVAEDSGMIEALDQWVMHTACEQYRAWADRGLALGRMAVNVSGREVERGTLMTSVRGVLAMTGIPAERLELELIESYLMRGSRMADTLASVREAGVAFAVDDFGTGYSSLAYLKQLPVDVLKIDRSFIERLDHEDSERAIVAAIVTMAHSLGMTVVAEGVETEAQLEAVRQIGCDTAQGYLLGWPLPPDAFAERFGSPA